MEALNAWAPSLAQHVHKVASERLTRSSPELWMALLPVAAYWLVAGIYDVLDRLQLPWTERYRIRSEAEKEKRNSRSRTHVILRVLTQHIIQVSVSIGLVFVDPEMCDARRWSGWLTGGCGCGDGACTSLSMQHASCACMRLGWQHVHMHGMVAFICAGPGG